MRTMSFGTAMNFSQIPEGGFFFLRPTRVEPDPAERPSLRHRASRSRMARKARLFRMR